jgi:hypothetical protein
MGDEAIVDMPFTEEMLAQIARGRKCCTGRKRRYGKVGDIIRSTRYYRNVTVELRLKMTTQIRTTRAKIAQHLYKHEGFGSPEDYIKVSTEISNAVRRRWKHQEKPFDPEELIWIHWFADKAMPKYLRRKLITKKTKMMFTVQSKLEEIA